MPRETKARDEESGSLPLERDPELRRALRPWIDLAEVGAPGLRIWLLSVLPLLPVPASRGTRPLTDAERLSELAKALADCAGDRARVHFQASEYFRENQVLARRVKALEAMVRLKRKTEGSDPADLSDPEAEAATLRYFGPTRR
jgi:hypothetical protein